MQLGEMSGLADWLSALYTMAAGCHVGTAKFCFSVVNLSYWKPWDHGGTLHSLFKQAITPLYHYHRKEEENEAQLQFSGRDFGSW